MIDHRTMAINYFKAILTCGIILSGVYCRAQSRYQQLPEQQHFNVMADYLTAGSGKWRGENPRHNPGNPRSPQAFGLWFERPMYNLLTLKIVAYRADTIIISSQGTFSWHPEKQHYIHITADRGGGHGEGVTQFPNDSTFISIMKIYRPNGKVIDHKDENFIINKDQHGNTSFKKNEQGEWVENGRWVWKREPLE